MSAKNIARALDLRRSGHEFVGACPSCGYRTGFSITEKDGRLLVYCAAGGCEQPALWAALVKQGLVRDRGEQRAPRRQRRTAKNKGSTSSKGSVTVTTTKQALALWGRIDSANGTLVERYLIGRGLVDDISISGIRYLPRFKHRSGVS